MIRGKRMLLIATIVGAGAVAHAAPGVKGTVTFDGAAPARTKVRRDTDPYCGKTEQLSDDVIVVNGKLKDVLVRIKNGSFPVDESLPPPAQPALIDQKACTYLPHVLGVVAGQKIAVRNSDGTFHNVHGSIKGTLTWNKPAIPNDPPLTLENPARPNDVIDVVCDVHPWMHAYAVVQDHSKFAVTGDDGGFDIPDLPPGTYTLEAWHPVLGLKTATFKLRAGAKASTPVTLTYRRADLK